MAERTWVTARIAAIFHAAFSREVRYDVKVDVPTRHPVPPLALTMSISLSRFDAIVPMTAISGELAESRKGKGVINSDSVTLGV
jgi:hypothetical protein